MRKADEDDVLRKFEIGVRRGVARALEEHRKAGRSIVVWEDGKIVWIPPEQIPPLVDESSK
ncbi:MAG: hypothetical protein ACE15E_24185 [Acidobacteriota bacterium]